MPRYGQLPDDYKPLAPSKMNGRNSHKHQCPKCGFIWQHSDAMAGNWEAHTCPCGGESWSHYDGRKKADYKGCLAPKITKAVEEALKTRKPEKRGDWYCPDEEEDCCCCDVVCSGDYYEAFVEALNEADKRVSNHQYGTFKEADIPF